MKLMPDWLLSSLSDGDAEHPHTSVSRLIALLTVTVCVVLPFLLWFWLSCFKGELLKIPEGLTIFMGTASGISLAMFAANKRAE